MLDDISGVKTWSKINSGMKKMYMAEVLLKLPIMQHFLFGSLLPFEPSGPMPSDNDEIIHVHGLGQMNPICCGIRIPSAIGAATDKSHGKHGGLTGSVRRPLPFD